MGGRLAVAYDVSMTKECSPRWIEVEYRRATKPGRPEMGRPGKFALRRQTAGHQ